MKNMRTNRAIAQDYDYLIANPLSTEECMYCLSWAQVKSVIATLDYLGWKTRWYSDSETPIDLDKIEAFRDDLSRRLAMSCCGQSTPVLSRTTPAGDLEISTDGGATWIPDPFDPRKTVTLLNPLPASTPNIKCQAAWNTRKSMENAVNAVANVLDVTLTLLAIATAIAGVLAVLLFNPTQAYKLIPVVIQLAVSIAALSKTDFLAAFTATVYDNFQCLIYCNTDASGNVNIAQVRSQLASKFSGIPLNGFSLIITCLGDAGMNNLARTDAGAIGHDCTSCACSDCSQANWIWSTSAFGAPAVNFTRDAVNNTIAGSAVHLPNGHYYFGLEHNTLKCCQVGVTITSGNQNEFKGVMACTNTNPINYFNETLWAQRLLPINDPCEAILLRSSQPFAVSVHIVP